MSSKTTSPESAQRKVWMAELKTMTRARKKVLADSSKAARQNSKEWAAARNKFHKTIGRINREVPKAIASIDRRIAILEGRIGI
jgi:hypothetical protein